ncbi:hypothetical protein niasHT_021051 [Heterodera trifolii]|uniref:Transposase n=1 Tax=Heterodera trifolii TaxID=157864 RepID=A0ABD2KCX6_9BILA
MPFQRAGAHSTREWMKIEREIAEKIGTSRTSIYRWKAQLGLTKNRRYSDEEKRKIMAKYYQMKRENPRIMMKTMCKKLNISMATLYRWIEIGEGQQKPEKATGEMKHQKFNNLNNYEKTFGANGNGQNVWAWNFATGRRQRKTKLASLY